MLLIDRFPGKVRPKDECLPSYPTTQNSSSYEQQHWTKVYSLIEVLFILLFMNCAWIRIHQRLIQLFPGVCLIRHYYSKRNRKLKWRKQLSDMRMLFWSFTSLQEKKLYPLPLSHCLKTWRKIIISSRWSTKYLTCSRAYISVSPWVLIYRWKGFTKMGIRKRNIPKISNQGTELFKEYLIF